MKSTNGANKFYHASLNPNLPDVITPTETYEDSSHGCPQPRFGDVSLGFPESEIPEIAFSKKPEDGMFAVAQNISHDADVFGGKVQDTTMYIYTTEQEPDVDLSDCGYDFDILSEVRYRKPVTIRKEYQARVPAKTIKSVGKLYGAGYKPPTLEEALADEIIPMRGRFLLIDYAR